MNKSYVPAKRQSNLELLRIVGMLLIIAHHYVVNTGIMDNLSLAEHPSRVIFLNLFGMWGKTGINIFILISGYFMCQSNLTIRRYCKIAFEWIFYHYVIYFIMLAAGYETVTLKRVYQLVFAPFIYANGSGCFTSSFLMFYLFIPFLNRFICSVNRMEYRRFVLLLLFVFTGLSTFFTNTYIFGEVFWFCAVYFIGGYLRLSPPLGVRACGNQQNSLFSPGLSAMQVCSLLRSSHFISELAVDLPILFWMPISSEQFS